MTAVPVSPAARAAAASRRGTPRAARVRDARERLIRGALAGCALLSVVTTFAIVGILAGETVRFLGMPEVSVADFLTGTTWSPLLGAEKQFGIWPLVCGTLLVTAIAAAFALPVGLVTAIYLSEYAPPRVRTAVKPALEVLAGIPTVVYGYFALAVITPFLHDHVSEGFGTFNALGAGLAVGIMILPIVASLSEDALRAVPRSLRDAAYAMGGTRFDVSVKVVVPAALSGIMASWLLAITRAIGETMIVALAAGGMAAMTLSPTAEVQTMTAYMVQIFLGDAPATGVEYRSSYAVATVLFVVTLGLTLVGNLVLRRFREEYD
jgi:phosphate transport system permease protein